MKNQYYDTPRNFYADWQDPLVRREEICFPCHLKLVKNKYDKIINISKIKTLAKHHENVVAKVFFYDESKFTHLESNTLKKSQGDVILTCPEFEEEERAERVRNSTFEFKKSKAPAFMFM